MGFWRFKMNRLILIGNGFDLAHGLKTSYCDFIRWYLAEALNKFRVENYYDDELLVLSQKYASMSRFPPGFPTDSSNSIQLFNYLIEDDNDYWGIKIKSNLLNITINKSHELNWVDIELEYFDELARCEKDGVFNKELVFILNKQFGFLKAKLREYLLSQQLDLDNFIPDGQILGIMMSNFRYEDFDTTLERNVSKDLRWALSSKDRQHHYPLVTFILNFNYTNTIEKYAEVLSEDSYHKHVAVNYIHGQLESSNNPVIFGFGDEFNSSYTQFEEQKNNDVFEHIKSYWYFKSGNYRNLVRFLDAEMFQVFIMGHSCGLSDRTMFREIFEHENCKSVKIFFYEKPDGTNDFHQKTVELGRHFTNKGKMRKKIVEFDVNCKFPQP